MRVSSNPAALGGPTDAELRASSIASTKLSDELGNIAQTKADGNQEELEKTFQDFVGQTFFGQMIASMRATQEDAPYFHGGRAEKIFQGQLDQVLAEELSDSSAAQFSDPMFKLFQLHRQ
jgi:peptidoglycan hydrolase FlgJ